VTRLLYISNARIPTPMAHGLQIMQNCEAFAETGVEVRLWCARRRPLPGAEAQGDPWDYYGVRQNFRLRRLPCLDLTPLAAGRDDALARLLFYLQLATFALAACIGALFARADLIYSRDPLALFALSLIKPRRALVYEAHRLNQPGRGAWLQRQVLRRAAHTVAVTPPLADGLARLQADLPPAQQSRLMVAHDGIRAERFASMSAQAEARQVAGWPAEAFIVGYVGRLKTMGMDKGVDTLIEAIALLAREGDAPALALVGGPDEIAATYRARWIELGLPPGRFLYAGQVEAERVPLYLSAFDLCAMPFPWTEHFAYHASPIKLFEYMASGRALIASDLPSYADVIQHEVNALLTPPSDAPALAAAIQRLRADTDLRSRLGVAAQERVMADYTWDARARAILNFVRATDD
jgi:glycosyltransferase involved in cell wall biosynthesis